MPETETKAGLNFNPRTVNQLAWGVQRKNSPFSYVPPGISGEAGELHNSMTAAWRLPPVTATRAGADYSGK